MIAPRNMKEARVARTLKDAFGPYAELSLHTTKRPWHETAWFWPVMLITAVVLWLALNLVMSFDALAKEHHKKIESYTASWYGPGFHGRKTANGERFNQHALTAAHRTLPFGTLLAVTHKGKTTVVRVNDRGPFVRGREIDLSAAAAREIGLRGVGIVSINQIGG